MTNYPLTFAITTIFFFILGGTIDYWQSARHHHKPLPKFLNDYFALLWLLLYSGVLPMLLIAVASNFNLITIKLYLSCAFFGMVAWDLIYSLFDQGKLISTQKDYFYWKNTDYRLSSSQVLIWHLIRITIGIFLLLI